MSLFFAKLWQALVSGLSIGSIYALIAEGYRVSVREKRECAEPGCKVCVQIAWGLPLEVPPRWYSSKPISK